MASSCGSSRRSSFANRNNAVLSGWDVYSRAEPLHLLRAPCYSLRRKGSLMTENNSIPRRKFLSQAAATAALTIVPRHVLGRGFVPPSDKLNIASIGVGGMGRANLINVASQNIVALCDADWGYAGKSLDRLGSDIEKLRARIDAPPVEPVLGQAAPEFNRERAKAQLVDMIVLKTNVPKAKRYKDYRQMLEQQKDIEAVIVATPDHMHATIALAAMDLGKHVYVQKPLTWSVDEARRLA